MHELVIADTSCLIVLQNIGELGLLHELYASIYTTSEVAVEFGEPLPEWVVIQDPADSVRLKEIQKEIDNGEASAIALALEFPESILILDDLKARKLALTFGLQIIGTLSVLMRAKNLGKISSMKEMLRKLRQANFRISPALEEKILCESGE